MRRLLMFVLFAAACRLPVGRPLPPGGPVQNAAFLPGPDARPARHSFEGTLVLSSAEMETLPETLESRTVFDRDTKLFPDVSIDFFTHEDHLVPADRDLIRSGSLAPGGSF